MRQAGLGLMMRVEGNAKPLPFVEDTAVPPEKLPEYVEGFNEILKRHGTTAGYYGHASVGCLHIRPIIDTRSLKGQNQLVSIAREVCELVLKFNGARLAAEAPEATRRTALAEWIVSPENPLTARVIVNRVWQYHFGTGLVDTPNDFGHNGAPPTHPEFLDWLATDFITHRWSLKHLHRRILGSRAFTQSSAAQPAALKRDAQSRLLWRFPPRRLEAEAIRDSILAASGKLDLAMGGPGFSLFEIEKENVRHYFPKQKFGTADWRRMVYATKFRQELDDVFGAFDCPDGNQSVPRRGRSTTPMQALNLLNSAFVLDQANHLAARVKKDAGEDAEAQVRRAFHLTLGRAPEARELAAAKKLSAAHGLPALARALFNTHEFITIP